MQDTFSILLLVAFVGAAFAHGWATRRLIKLDKLRLEKEPPPASVLPPGLTGLTQRLGLKLAPSNEELKSFCERHGLADEYRNANRWLYASIAVGLAAVFLLSKLVVPPK